MMPRIKPHPQKTFVGKAIFGKYLIGFYSQNFLVIFSHLIHSLVYGIDNLTDVIERIYNFSVFVRPFQHADIFLCYSACQWKTSLSFTHTGAAKKYKTMV